MIQPNRSRVDLTINPGMDGIDHINIYSQGKTELGVWLSNFTLTPFVHPEYGNFVSMEGFYHWVSTGFRLHALRKEWGFSTKKVVAGFDKVPCENFEAIIESGIRCKIRQNLHIRDALKESTLPLMHYYVVPPKNDKPAIAINPVQHQWITDIIIRIREELKEGIEI